LWDALPRPEHHTATEPTVAAHVPETSTPVDPPETQATPQPQPTDEAVYRTAVGYDPHTHHTSNVEDWSVQELTAAGKHAGLTQPELNELLHNRHNISGVNSAFYHQNHAVGADPHHYLDKTAYRVDDQREAAHDVVGDFTAKHSVEQPAATSVTAEANQQDSPELSDAQMDAIIRESLAATAEPAAAAPLPPEIIAGFSEQELKNIGTALGVIAAATATPIAANAWRGAWLARATAPENYGDKVAHREIPFHKKPTIPPFTTPKRYYEKIDKAYAKARTSQHVAA
jgi:hypothetical protein